MVQITHRTSQVSPEITISIQSWLRRSSRQKPNFFLQLLPRLQSNTCLKQFYEGQWTKLQVYRGLVLLYFDQALILRPSKLSVVCTTTVVDELSCFYHFSLPQDAWSAVCTSMFNGFFLLRFSDNMNQFSKTVWPISLYTWRASCWVDLFLKAVCARIYLL